MRMGMIGLLVLSGVLPMAAQARNLIINDSFDAPGDPLQGWHTDYAWTKNSHYIGNASNISVVESEAGQRHVAKMVSPGDPGVKMESVLIPMEQGAKYRARLKVKGQSYRIYFAGYQWRPGIRPHGDPSLQEMRPVYRSKAETGSAASWKTVTLELPGTEASELSLRHLSRVRFITLYIWFGGGGFVDDVMVTKL